MGEASVKEKTKKKVKKSATKAVSSGQNLTNQLNKQQNKHALHHFPSYVEVNPNQPIVIQPLPLRHSAQDNDMWAQIKFQMLPMPHLDSPLHCSSSTSDLTSCSSSDYYSNLADFSLGVESTEEILVSSSSSHQLRRHSFSEGDERLIVKDTASRCVQGYVVSVYDHEQLPSVPLSLALVIPSLPLLLPLSLPTSIPPSFHLSCVCENTSLNCKCMYKPMRGGNCPRSNCQSALQKHCTITWFQATNRVINKL